MAFMFSFCGIRESTLCSVQLYVQTCLRQVEMSLDGWCHGGQVNNKDQKSSSEIVYIVKRGVIEMDVPGIEKS